MFHFVYRRVGYDLATAEDIAQRVFAVVASKVGSLELTTSFRAYLFGIARNLAVDVQRAGKFEALDPFAASARNHSSIDRRLHQEDVLARAIRTLPDEEQILLELNKIERLTARELAAALGSTVASVNSKLVRIQNKVRKAVSTMAEEPSLYQRHLDSWVESVRGKIEVQTPGLAEVASRKRS